MQTLPLPCQVESLFLKNPRLKELKDTTYEDISNSGMVRKQRHMRQQVVIENNKNIDLVK